MLYDLRKVEELILERTKIPNAKDLLMPSNAPKEMNSVNENMAMSLGQAVAAFPEQDHLAHIQVHVDFWKSPIFGQNPMFIKKYGPMFVQHLGEHMVMWYVTHMVDVVSQEAGKDIGELMKYRDPETRKVLDQSLAAASAGVLLDAQGVFSKLPPIIEQAMQVVDQIQQANMPQDPAVAATVQIAQMENATKNREIESRMQAAQMKAQQDRSKLETETQGDQLDRLANAAMEQIKQSGDMRRTQIDTLARERMNVQDNMTALTIADAEVTSKEKVAVSKGTGLNPGSKAPTGE
jgi:hypothetical protein